MPVWNTSVIQAQAHTLWTTNISKRHVAVEQAYVGVHMLTISKESDSHYHDGHNVVAGYNKVANFT